VTFGLAPLLGAAAGGLVYAHAGPRALFLASAVLAVGGAMLAWAALSIPAMSRNGVRRRPRLGTEGLVPE
jgi:predicted MFS family arabinose efflux permease